VAQGSKSNCVEGLKGSLFEREGRKEKEKEIYRRKGFNACMSHWCACLL